MIHVSDFLTWHKNRSNYIWKHISYRNCSCSINWLKFKIGLHKFKQYHHKVYIKNFEEMKMKMNSGAVVCFSTVSDFYVICSVRTRQNFQARALGDFHDPVSSAARAWGHKLSSEAMHVYTGENRFSLWSYHFGTVFKSIQLSINIYRVCNHHLVLDIHQMMIGGLHNLYTFQWAIKSCLSYIEYWPENIKTCMPPCGG